MNRKRLVIQGTNNPRQDLGHLPNLKTCNITWNIFWKNWRHNGISALIFSDDNFMKLRKAHGRISWWPSVVAWVAECSGFKSKVMCLSLSAYGLCGWAYRVCVCVSQPVYCIHQKNRRISWCVQPTGIKHPHVYIGDLWKLCMCMQHRNFRRPNYRSNRLKAMCIQL